MKKIFFLVFLFSFLVFGASVSAAVPTVDFDWYQFGDKNLAIYAYQPTIFDPTVTTDSSITLFNWSFGADGNVNLSPNSINFTDTFADGDYTANPVWTVSAGTWLGDQNLSTISSNGIISSTLDTILSGKDINFHWRIYSTAGTNEVRTDFIRDLDGNGYRVTINMGGTIELRRIEADVLLVSAGNIIRDTWQDINVMYRDGNFSVYVDNVYKGSEVDTSSTDSNYAFYLRQTGTTGTFWDNFSISGQVIGNYDDNQTKYLGTIGTIPICLTAGNASGNKTTCHDLTTTLESGAAQITKFDINFLEGFGLNDSNTHAILKCTIDQNTTYDMNYTLLLNGTTVYTAEKDLNVEANVPISILNGDNTVIFICSFNNIASTQTSDINAFSLYTMNFRLVNEETGVALTDFSQFSKLLATNYRTNQSYNFKGTSTNNVNLISSIDESIRLDINYTGGVGFFKEYTLSILVPDANADLCVADTQTFASQIFTSSRRNGIIVRHAGTNCYALADYTKYAYETVQSNQTVTIAEPYVVYFFDGNTKIVLTNLDGSLALVHNIQTLLLNLTEYDLGIDTDYLAVSPIYNSTTKTNVADLLQIAYRNLANDNSLINFEVFLGSTSVWSYTETQSPNNVLIDLNTASFGISDNNILKLIATATNASGEERTITAYFTTAGVLASKNPILVIVLAVILFLFGITFVSTRLAFSWFGLIMAMAAIVLLSMAPGVWYIVFLQGIFLIITAYIGLIFVNETSVIS